MIALLAFLAGACSAEVSSSAEYATMLGNSTDDYIQEAQALSATFHSTVEDKIKVLAASGEGDVVVLATDVTMRETVQYLAVLEDAMTRYVEDLKSMPPPAAPSKPTDDSWQNRLEPRSLWTGGPWCLRETPIWPPIWRVGPLG